MSGPASLSGATRPDKRDFFFNIEPLSLANLGEVAEDVCFESPPPIVKRGRRLVAMPNEPKSDDELIVVDDGSFEFEMDLNNLATPPKSILRRQTVIEEISPSSKKRLSWSEILTTRMEYPPEEEFIEEVKKKKKAKASKRKLPKKQQKKKTVEKPEEALPSLDANVDEDEDDVKPLVIKNDDSDEDTSMLVIDDPDEENEEIESKEAMKKKKKSLVEIREEKKAAILEYDEVLKSLADTTWNTVEDVDEEFAILKDLARSSVRSTKKERDYTRAKEVMKKELDKLMSEADSENVQKEIAKKEGQEFEGWKAAYMEQSDNSDVELIDTVINCEEGHVMNQQLLLEIKEEEQRGMEIGEDVGRVDDMPDLANLIREYNEDTRARVDAIKEEIVSEAEGEEEKKKPKGKGAGRPHTPTTPKKKRDDEHPMTEEEVMAEIGRKKADAEEKAIRVKKQKLEDKERKKMEMKSKKEKEEREREEKRRKKREEHEREKKKKEDEDEINLFDRKPRSRAEAARRTKALLGIGKAQAQMDAAEETDEDEEEPRRKKRKYRRRRTSAVSFVRRAKEDDEEAGVGCGKYINNTCDVSVEELVTDRPVDSDATSDDENQTHHDVLSLPFLWTSEADKEELPEGAIGPRNFDADEAIKRQLNEVQKFSDGITDEYRAMTKRLDEMKLNLYADTTFRRTDHRIVHNIDVLSKWSIWPADLLPASDVIVPKYQFQTWMRPLTGKLVRIRPTHTKKDKVTSAELDRMTGAAGVVTKKEIEKNVDELIMSKLKKTTWTPLPSARNPFDVPEISSRKKPGETAADFRAAAVSSYIDKIRVPTMPGESNTKTRKKTRKEVLKAIAATPKPTVEEKKEKENIYKEEEEQEAADKEGYQYEWDEMGEIAANPMRDELMADFASTPYDGLEFEDVAMGEADHHHHLLLDRPASPPFALEPHDESQLGEAFSFMAAHMDE